MKKEKLIKVLREDNFCEEKEEPLVCLIVGAIVSGANFRKACHWAGINRNDKQAKKWWDNLKKGNFIENKKIHWDFDSKTELIQLILAINIGKGYLEMKSETIKMS